MQTEEKIVIKIVGKPGKEDINALSDWFCKVFDLAGNDDTLEPAIFKEIIRNSLSGDGVTSKGLNAKFSMPRSTVIYHLNRFIYTGIVVRKGRKYYLRSTDLASTMIQIQAEVEMEFNRIISFAEKMDNIVEANSSGRRRKK